MSTRRAVPAITVARLSVYHRALSAMLERRRSTVSSAELADSVGVNAATLRRDLSRLGSYGTRGTGYDISHLLGQVNRALGLDRQWPIVIVGIGNLGRALARSAGFSSGGFEVAALVDVSPQVVGTKLDALRVEHVEDLATIVARESITIGVVATPPHAARAVSDALVAAGVRALLNFAPTVLPARPGVVVRQVDLSVELQVLAFYRTHPDEAPGPGEPSGASGSVVEGDSDVLRALAGGAVAPL